MDSFLCDEESSTLFTPTSTPTPRNNRVVEDISHVGPTSYRITEEENEAVLSLYLDKEVGYMPRTGYVELLRSKNLLLPRFRAVQWLVKSGIRLSLSLETIFNAVNCLDRFFSVNQCDEWTRWMVELLSLTCLAVASKFNETNSPSPHEIQMEGLEYSFQPATIQRMELIVLDTLGWRLHPATPYSFVDILITKNIDQLRSFLDKGSLVARVTDLLLTATLDCQLVEYRPSVAAAAAILYSLEDLKTGAPPASHITNLFNHDQQISLIKCRKMLEEAGGSKGCKEEGEKIFPNNCNPSSPVTVLVSERVDVKDCLVDLSPLEHGGSNKTRVSIIGNKRRKLLFEDHQPLLKKWV